MYVYDQGSVQNYDGKISQVYNAKGGCGVRY